MKKALSIILSLFMIISTITALPIISNAQTASGMCGGEAFYTFDFDTGKLTISGAGPMSDFNLFDSFPEYKAYAYQIKSVEIEYGITKIGNYAFSNDYTNLAEIKIAPTVTSIGTAAFKGCSALDNLKIPHSVASIDLGAFLDCSKLSTVVMPKSVNSIGNTAFHNCEGINSVYYAGSEQDWQQINIGLDNAPLENASISYDVDRGLCGDTVEYAFFFKQGVLYIMGEGEIYDFKNDYDRPWDYYKEEIKGVTIEDSLAKIGDNAFGGCTEIISVDYKGSADWDDIDIGEKNEPLLAVKPQNVITGKCGENVKYKLYLANGELDVYGSGKMYDYNESTNISPFYGLRDKIKSAYICGGVTYVGTAAFVFCDKLEYVYTDENVAEIGLGAFNYCTFLKKVVFSSGLTMIEDFAFDGCTQINTVEYISEGAVSGNWNAVMIGYKNDSITAVKPQTTVESGSCGIGVNYTLNYQSGVLFITGTGEMFETPWTPYARMIKKVYISYGVKNIALGAFSNCNNLKYVRYDGNDKQWDDVYIGENNEPLLAIKPQTAVPQDTQQQAGSGLTPSGSMDNNSTLPKADAVKVQTKKKSNTITVKAKTVTLKAKNIKKKNKTVAQKTAFTVSKAKGKVTYKKTSGNKNITVSSAGKITVKKGLKKGTYKIKVKVTAAGNATYKAKSKTVTVTVKIK